MRKGNGGSEMKGREMISYTKPSIGKLEIDMVTDAIAHGWGI